MAREAADLGHHAGLQHRSALARRRHSLGAGAALFQLGIVYFRRRFHPRGRAGHVVGFRATRVPNSRLLARQQWKYFGQLEQCAGAGVRRVRRLDGFGRRAATARAVLDGQGNRRASRCRSDLLRRGQDRRARQTVRSLFQVGLEPGPDAIAKCIRPSWRIPEKPGRESGWISSRVRGKSGSRPSPALRAGDIP